MKATSLSVYAKGDSKKSISSRNFRKELFKTQEGKCFWCSGTMELNPLYQTCLGKVKHNPRYASFEHLIPKSLGGLLGRVNKVLTHAQCNHDRAKKRWPHDPIYGKIKRDTSSTDNPQASANISFPREDKT